MFSRPGRMYSIGRPSLSNPLRILGVYSSAVHTKLWFEHTFFPFHSQFEPTPRTFSTGCQSRAETISQGYLFWRDQVGFEISPPLYRLLDPLLRILESPGRELSIGPLRAFGHERNILVPLGGPHIPRHGVRLIQEPELPRMVRMVLWQL